MDSATLNRNDMVCLMIQFSDGGKFFNVGARFKVVGSDGPLVTLRVPAGSYRISVRRQVVKRVDLN
ncbi:MAG: hypothetical protein KBE65_15910 [Phycisphaerae bacterium]|nr:hypothetical protein [Phycisphaerae bacterium]